MKLKVFGLSMVLLSATACTLIPTNGNDTAFTREGTLDCPPELSIDPALLAGTEDRPVRCTPQSQPLQ